MNRISKSAGVEGHIKSLAWTGATLIALLALTLVAVQTILQQRLNSVYHQLIPLEQGLTALEAELAKAFEHQSLMHSTRNTQELEALKFDARLDQQLKQTGLRLSRLASTAPPEVLASLQPLAGHLERFLNADHALYHSIAQRHRHQASLDKRRNSVDSTLFELLREVRSISGIARLDFVLLLRQLHQPHPSPAQLRELTTGELRARHDTAQLLVESLLGVRVVAAKMSQATSLDELNSIKANELSQLENLLTEKKTLLARYCQSAPELQQKMEGVEGKWEQVRLQLAGDTSGDSLLALRRIILEEVGNANRLRDESIAAATILTTDARQVELVVNQLVDQLSGTTQWTLFLTTLWTALLLLGGLGLAWIAAGRIRQSVFELRENNLLLANLSSKLEGLNTSLERQVAQRTQALEERKNAMQLVLDHMGDGLLSISLDGEVKEERSRAIEQWFGTPDHRHVKVWELLFADAPDQALQFEVCFEQLTSEILPFEVAADQMPRRIHCGTQTLALDYKPLYESQQLTGIVLVVRNISDRLEAERADQEARELQTIVGNILTDRPGFLLTFEEISNILYQLNTPLHHQELLHLLHTLKGNCAVYGFQSVASYVHTVESAVIEREDGLEPGEYDGIRFAWNHAIQRISQWMDMVSDQTLEIYTSDIEALRSALIHRVDHAELLNHLERWEYPAVQRIFQRLGAQAERIARSLGKELRVEIQANAVRIRPDLAPFWSSIIHVIRNAVDHGIELPEERLALGKPAQGCLRLSARVLSDGSTRLQFSDDGRGIQQEALQQKVQSLGLNPSPLCTVSELIFLDGVSTKTTTTELSGRGVGLGAVREVCRKLQIEPTVKSQPDQGTTFEFLIPPAGGWAGPRRVPISSLA